MPSAIAYVGAQLLMNTTAFSAFGAFLLSNAAIIGTALTVIGGLAYSSSKAKSAKKKAKDQFNAAQVDRMVNITSSTAPRDLVLGRVRKGGAYMYKASTGANQQDLYLAIALAGHEIDAVEQIYLDDVAVTLDGSGNVLTAPWNTTSTPTATLSTGTGYTATLPSNYVPGSVSATYRVSRSHGEGADTIDSVPCSVSVSGLTATTSQPGATISYQYTVVSSNVQITVHLGQPGQAADAQLVAAFGAAWVAANVAQDVAYLVARLRYSETSFPNGVPSITARIRGAKVYDPRTGVTAWSDNPALLACHVYQNPKFGKATVTATEDARFAASANACDISTTYTVGGVAQPARPLYRAGIVAEFGTETKSVLDDLYQAMGGSWAFAGGEFFSQVGVYTAPVMSLTDADLAVIQRDGASETQNPISISVHKQRAEQFNTVTPTIWDQDQDYKETPLSSLVASALLARDGVSLVEDVPMPAVSYAPQALHVAGILLRDARDPLVVSLPFKLRAYPLELFDNVTLTLSRYGWINKVFRIIGRSWNMDGTLQLTLKETSAAITQMDAGFSAQGFASNTNLPKPWEVAAVGLLSILSGTDQLVIQQDGTVQSRMRISWPQISDAAVKQSGQIEVQYRRADSSGAWASLIVPGEETQVITTDVIDSAVYIIRARAKTRIAVGDWCLQKQHQVIGKTEPPSNVSGFTIDGTRLMWERVADIDLAGYMIRYQYGSNQEWGTANPMHEGLITDMPYLMRSVPPGTVTVLIKAVDTTGNQSMSPAYVVTDLGDPLVANVVESKDFKADGWPGAVTHATVVSGNLQATQSDPAYRADASDFYGVDSALFYSNNFDGLVWESEGWTPTLAAAGSNMTAAWTLTGDAPNIQYRQTGAGLFFSADTDPFYGESTSRFYEETPPWQSWPGSVVADDQEYQWRVSTSPGSTSGLLSSFVVSVDVPDKTVKLNSVAIAPGGTRLSAVAGQFNVIQNIQLTLQGGGSATYVEITDYNAALGPLITAKNAGTSVAATIDALLQGY